MRPPRTSKLCRPREGEVAPECAPRSALHRGLLRPMRCRGSGTPQPVHQPSQRESPAGLGWVFPAREHAFALPEPSRLGPWEASGSRAQARPCAPAAFRRKQLGPSPWPAGCAHGPAPLRSRWTGRWGLSSQVKSENRRVSDPQFSSPPPAHTHIYSARFRFHEPDPRLRKKAQFSKWNRAGAFCQGGQI